LLSNISKQGNKLHSILQGKRHTEKHVTCYFF
jgi:hypothetical protein